MANTRIFKPSFSGGELSPEMFGRIDDAKFQNGAAVIQNMITTPLGPAEKRPGFEYVCATKANGVARLIPFDFSTTQTMVIEMGAGYFRFHTQGETLLAGTPAAFRTNVSAAVSISYAFPCVVTWAAHGFSNNEPVAFWNVPAGGGPTFPPQMTQNIPYYVTVIDANTFHISATVGGAFINGGGIYSGPINGYYFYGQGALVTYGGNVYYMPNVYSGGVIPTSAPWFELPSTAYEIPNNFAAGDLFAIHYVQSEDVMTLVHVNYPPVELRRLGATEWTLVPISFGQALSAPAGVSVSGLPGYQATIASIATGLGANPALFTTAGSHTLALGDGIYIKGMNVTIGGNPTQMDGFYLVDKVPVDGSGNLIPNELYVMDYSGNALNGTGWTINTLGTIQYGSQIFDITNYYVVTAIASDGVQESAISAEVSVLNNLNVTGSYNTISWAAVPGAFRYFIYKKRNGLYGYIGEAAPSVLTFNDNNIAPDMSITPPVYDSLFASAGNYPGAVGYYQQRRSFAGTTDNTQTLWMSKSGTESDFSYSLPVKDTDRIAATMASRESATIQHIVPLNQLVLLTSSSELCVSPLNSDTLTPTTISSRPQSYIGASPVQPTIVNNTMVYCANRGGHVREMGYQWQIGGYVTGDISLRAAHLFDNLTIADQAYMKSPWQVVWFVSSNGNLLGLTYIPEEQIGAWHHQMTDGAFESIACVAEGNEDHLYAVINRTVNGNTVRYIERMSSRNFTSIEDGFFVDAGATFDGTNLTGTTVAAALHVSTDGLNGTYDLTASAAIFAYPATTDDGDVLVLTGPDGTNYRLAILSESSATHANAVCSQVIPPSALSATNTWAWARQTISGMTWLEGEMVAILADGSVQPQQTVTGGAITLQYPSVLVTIGIPYTAEINTLPVVLQIEASGQGRTKNINRCWIRVQSSSSIFAGPSPDRLIELKQRTTENLGMPPNLITDEREIVIPASWQTSGQIYVQQSDPLPLTVVGLTLEVAIGG